MSMMSAPCSVIPLDNALKRFIECGLMSLPITTFFCTEELDICPADILGDFLVDLFREDAPDIVSLEYPCHFSPCVVCIEIVEKLNTIAMLGRFSN